MIMKVKQKIAAVLALSMILSSQPISPWNTSFADTEADQDRIWNRVATESEAEADSGESGEEIPEDIGEILPEEEERYQVSYFVTPEGSADIEGDIDVEAGKNLTFQVYPEEGYEIQEVMVNGTELTDFKEKKSFLFFFGDTYYEYKVEHVEEDLDVTLVMKGISDEAEKKVVLSGGVEITVEAVDEGALQAVSYIEAEILPADGEMEQAIQSQMEEGQSIVDYAAFDIRLYDEEGEEVEPEGQVSVQISGITTEEEYEEIGIYHVEKTDTGDDRAAVELAAKGKSEEYYAEEVIKEDRYSLENQEEIQFVTDHFSTYVVTFIKSASEFTDVTIHLVTKTDSGIEDVNYNINNMDITLGSGKIAVTQLVSGYRLYEIQDTVTGANYAYEYATWGTDPAEENRITEISYEDLKEKTDLYLWYEAMDNMKIPVAVYFDGVKQADPESKYQIYVGEIGYEDAQQVLRDAGEMGTYEFEKAMVESADTAFEITSVTRINDQLYVRQKDSDSVVTFDPDYAEIALYFKEGHDITISVEGSGSDIGNTVDGVAYDTTTINRQIAVGGERVIPVTIAQGYGITVTDTTDGVNQILYDSSAEENQIRDYTLTINDAAFHPGSDKTLKVTFWKMDPLKFDYSHILDPEETGGVIINLHGASVTLDGKNLAEDQSGSLAIDNNTELVITHVRKRDALSWDTLFTLNALAINGQAVEVPVDPGRDNTTHTTAALKDQKGDKIADVTITASCEYHNSIITWERKETRIYTITFTNVTSNLKLTTVNLHGDNAEAVLREKGEGVTVYAGEKQGEETAEVGIHGLMNPPLTLKLVPEFGHYVTDVRFNGENWEIEPIYGTWYGPQRTRSVKQDFGSAENVAVHTAEIQFIFQYGDQEDTNQKFSLGIHQGETAPLNPDMAPEAPEGQVFAGWFLKGDADQNLYLPSQDVERTISKDMIRNYADTAVEYRGEDHTAVIKLEPKFVPASQAEQLSYQVKVSAEGKGEKFFGPYFGVKGDGFSITQTMAMAHEEVNNAVEELLREGYIMDTSQSDAKIILREDEEKNIFHLHYIKSYEDVTITNASEDGDITYNNAPVTESLKLSSGEVADFVIKPHSGWTIKTITVNGNPSPTPGSDDYVEGKYTFRYTVLQGNNQIVVSYAEDKNGNHIPDDKEKRVNITFTAGTNGSLEGTLEYKDQLPGLRFAEAGITIPTPKANEGYVFWKWEPTITESTLVPEISTEYKAVFDEDKNGDGKPDSEQTIITITFDAGTEGNMEGAPTKVYYVAAGEDNYPSAPEVTVTAEKRAFKKWNPDYTGSGLVPEEAVAQTYTAEYADDRNGDGTPDDDQFFLTPKHTTIYTGGKIEDVSSFGFPQPEADEDVKQITVNGETIFENGNEAQEETALNQLFGIHYYEEGDTGFTAPIRDDRQKGVYIGKGYVREEHQADTIQINGKEVVFDTGKLVIRDVSDPEAAVRGDIYQRIVTEVTEPVKKSVAVIPSGSQIYTNNDSSRPVDSSHKIALMDDSLLATANTEDSGAAMLIAKGNEFLAGSGMSADVIKNLVYDFHYLDLVDMDNGNAWVSSTDGATIYMPYPEGTDQNMEFTVLHFKDLHREYGMNNQANIEEAIKNSQLELVADITKDAYGIKFHVGQSGFSPFAIVYDQRDADKEDGNNEGSVNDYGTVDNPYVVGLNGQWVHMDPSDVFQPIVNEVPEGATPVANPEWHRWKFMLTNGTMIFNKWVYISNPYAVGDQPEKGWFYFDNDGLMQYGWFMDPATGKWYYLHRDSDGMLGTLQYGWHYDEQDGKWYYLNMATGEMMLGWQQINGKWYYLNPYAQQETWSYQEQTGGWTYNGSSSRPYGSMYQNEMTPDGYRVDENGAWIQ